MPSLLTESQLEDNILTLKDNIDAFEQDNQYSLAFFNAWCFYDHITRMPSINGLLDTIEPYIPLNLDTGALDAFIQTAQEQERMEGCADAFMLKARVDFVDSLQKANTPERWSRLVGICGAIRDIKEQLWLLVR